MSYSPVLNTVKEPVSVHLECTIHHSIINGNIGVGYHQAKGYCKAKFSIPDVPGIHEIKAVKKIGLCYRCVGSHIQCECRSNGSNKF